jgi:hypothetical protein
VVLAARTEQNADAKRDGQRGAGVAAVVPAPVSEFPGLRLERVQVAVELLSLGSNLVL